MSLKTETFYAIRCDFPECRTLVDDDEHTYWADPYYNADTAQDDGWLIGAGEDDGRDYCPEHTIEVDDCPDPDDCDCAWYSHRAPAPDTWATRLDVALARLAEDAARRIGYVERKVCNPQHGDLGDRGHLAHRARQGLEGIFERAVLRHDPDLTPTDLWRLKRATS